MSNQKASKKKQPKRMRYNSQKRWIKNQIKQLEKHLKKASNDTIAKNKLDALKKENNDDCKT